MRFLRHAALALLVMLGSAGLSGEVIAQIASGRSGMSTSDPLGNVQAFRELRAFGVCYVRANRRGALALIATVPGSNEESEIFRRLVNGEQDCLFGGTRMTLPVVFMRGAIAEGLLRSGGVPETLRLTAPAPADAHTLHDAARCYTTGHRTEVQALLETQPDSQEEIAAIRALWSDFRVCLTGPVVRLSAPWIRYLLAEALLRLPPAGAQAGN
jgi:hypothetical protein